MEEIIETTRDREEEKPGNNTSVREGQRKIQIHSVMGRLSFPRHKASSPAHLKSFLMHINVCCSNSLLQSMSHSCPQTSKITVKHQYAWVPSSCVAMMIQQWELTDWWNNEQWHAG